MATKDNTVYRQIVGLAHGIQQRTESRGGELQPWVIWTFRIDRYDASGNPLPPVPVQMRGYSFDGFINEGDQVELPIDVSRDEDTGGLVHVTLIRNLSTEAVFQARGPEPMPKLAKIFLILFAILFSTVFLIVCAVFILAAVFGYRLIDLGF